MGLYAAYASNLHPHRMAQRAPHSPLRGTGWVRGWRLTFGGEERGWDGALATLVEDDDPAAPGVFVALYDLHATDEDQLDEWEGLSIGLHVKVRLRVATLDGEQVAWAYVLDGYEGGLPSAFYVEMLATAAQAAGAPDDYVAALRARPHRGVERGAD
jgi:hypothetical protein